MDILKRINWKMIGAVVLPFVGSSIGSVITKNSIDSGWYKNLNFPALRPPNWVFGPVWTCLYIGMGYASYLVYKSGGESFTGDAKIPLILYGTQLLLNWAWTPLFFGAHEIRIAFYEIVFLLAGIAATTGSFFRINKIAGALFLPYLAWTSFATYLNYRFMVLNEKKAD